MVALPHVRYPAACRPPRTGLVRTRADTRTAPVASELINLRPTPGSLRARPDADRKGPPLRHRNIQRIAQILELVASRNDGMTLSEVATAIEAPISSIRDLLGGLVSTGFLDRMKSRYVLGPMPYVLTIRSEQPSAAYISHNDLEILAAEGGFTVVFGVRVGDDFVYIDEAGDHPYLIHLARSRARWEMLASIVGKVFLAAMDDDELHHYLRRHPNTDLVDEFLSEVGNIRREGVGTDVVHGIAPRVGYPGNDTYVIATAVRNHMGRPIGAVSIGQDPEYFNAHREEMAQILLRHSRHWAERSTLAQIAPS